MSIPIDIKVTGYDAICHPSTKETLGRRLSFQIVPSEANLQHFMVGPDGKTPTCDGIVQVVGLKPGGETFPPESICRIFLCTEEEAKQYDAQQQHDQQQATQGAAQQARPAGR